MLAPASSPSFVLTSSPSTSHHDCHLLSGSVEPSHYYTFHLIPFCLSLVLEAHSSTRFPFPLPNNTHPPTVDTNRILDIRKNISHHLPNHTTTTRTMKGAIALAAASFALANAASAPNKLVARASKSSSGSLPAVTVKGNGGIPLDSPAQQIIADSPFSLLRR